MSAGRLILCALACAAMTISVSAAGVDDVFLVYGRSAHAQVKLVRFITEFPGTFPVSLMRATELTIVFHRKGKQNIVAASRPTLTKPTLDSLAEWLVPFNPMNVDTFAVAVRVLPLREAIMSKSKHLGSPHARLVSVNPWYRKGIQVSDTLGGKPRPGINRFKVKYEEPTFNADSLGALILYPAAAKQRGLTATIYMAALVNTYGLVDDLVILESENDVFNESAARAIRCLHFKPGIVHGTPATMWVRVPISFRPD